MDGLMAMALANPTLFFMPPDSSAGILSSMPLSPTSASFSVAMERISSSDIFVCCFREKPTFSHTESESKSAAIWKSMPNFLRASFKPR